MACLSCSWFVYAPGETLNVERFSRGVNKPIKPQTSHPNDFVNAKRNLCSQRVRHINFLSPKTRPRSKSEVICRLKCLKSCGVSSKSKETSLVELLQSTIYFFRPNGFYEKGHLNFFSHLGRLELKGLICLSTIERAGSQFHHTKR